MNTLRDVVGKGIKSNDVLEGEMRSTVWKDGLWPAHVSFRARMPSVANGFELEVLVQ